jgi:hypothetical protein
VRPNSTSHRVRLRTRFAAMAARPSDLRVVPCSTQPSSLVLTQTCYANSSWRLAPVEPISGNGWYAAGFTRRLDIARTRARKLRKPCVGTARACRHGAGLRPGYPRSRAGPGLAWALRRQSRTTAARTFSSNTRATFFTSSRSAAVRSGPGRVRMWPKFPSVWARPHPVPCTRQHRLPPPRSCFEPADPGPPAGSARRRVPGGSRRLHR